jgi:hypothetical protein
MVAEATAITEPYPVKVAAEIVEVVVAEKHSFYVSHRGKGAKDAGVYS